MPGNPQGGNTTQNIDWHGGDAPMLFFVAMLSYLNNILWIIYIQILYFTLSAD
jgi:hypothetical protein